MKPLVALVLLLAAADAVAAGGKLAGSKHDLSVTGPGPIRAVSERNPCVFCHVPHNGSNNRPDVVALHRPYESTTMSARPGSPNGATRVCLSCHDGTIAVGQTRARRIETTVATIGAERASNLGTDLRRTHPVSFTPVPGSGTHAPAPGDAVKLDAGRQVQCTSCHDPHEEYRDPRVGKFLVKPSERSALCLTCHDAVAVQRPGASHAESTAHYGPAEGNTAGWGSVADAGCMACHASHGADPKGQLVARPLADDDALCLRCHATSVVRRPLAADLAKPSAHAGAERGVHDAGEGRPGAARPLPERSPGTTRHVTCVDCHDPHAASGQPAVGTSPGGALAGVWGIDRNGARVAQIRSEYELCFKCHADSANKPQSGGPRPPDLVRRAVVDVNLREVFGPTAVSSHPVLGPGRNPDVPSLRAPWTAASTVACGDCHASDTGPGAGGSGARGPHGSIYPPLLERAYSTSDATVESPAAYALCYKCHDRAVLLSTRSSFAEHARHLGPTVNAPCSACHAAHGISATAGTPDGNAHLVSFDLAIVRASAGGPAQYRSLGRAQGSCTLSCHGTDHRASTYGGIVPAGFRRGAALRRAR
ncbi:cytochrome c3 family protein [Anaeromyxobacter oryzae]|uniref:Cytochrome c n=1 Tax=Anaeromyxobacter oryzae TaxID=2918170 RepID=A0ABN6N0X4_9BACT|nr:cytochrome c3 family protein [Anaeromyxobacter oryzae]BDG06845.1 cytochrome c [Anaeromyxobacter oryzae]